jgi:5-methyltetrahydropteroyltriglutamate--homocysteine methyltransferase
MTKLFPTTISGSLPKPRWLAGPEQLWASWQHDGEDLIEAKQDAVRIAVRDQQRAGIDIVTDGEQTRQHFVTTFIEGLDGVDFDTRATVKIRQRYEATVPRVVGPVSRPRPVYLDDARFLVSETTLPVK